MPQFWKKLLQSDLVELKLAQPLAAGRVADASIGPCGIEMPNGDLLCVTSDPLQSDLVELKWGRFDLVGAKSFGFNRTLWN